MEEKLSFHSSGDTNSFSIWNNITPHKLFRCGVMMDHWPNVGLVLAKLYPKLWGNCEPLNFMVFVRTKYHELKLSEVHPDVVLLSSLGAS